LLEVCHVQLSGVEPFPRLFVENFVSVLLNNFWTAGNRGRRGNSKRPRSRRRRFRYRRQSFLFADEAVAMIFRANGRRKRRTRCQHVIVYYVVIYRRCCCCYDVVVAVIIISSSSSSVVLKSSSARAVVYLRVTLQMILMAWRKDIKKGKSLPTVTVLRVM